MKNLFHPGAKGLPILSDSNDPHARAAADDSRIGAELVGLGGNTDPFVSAVRATRMPMVITNPRLPDNPVVFANDAFCRLSGYPRTEIVGRNCRFLQGPQTDPAAVAQIHAAVEAVRPIEIEIRNHRKDGSPFWNRLLMAPVRDAAGSLAYFFASQVDVTMERERLAGLESDNAALMAELGDRLRFQEESAARMRFATEAGRLGIWDLDLATGELTTSPRCRMIFGRDPAAPFAYDALRAMVHPDDRSRVEDAMTASIATAADCIIECRINRPDGSLGWVEMRAEVEPAKNGAHRHMAGVSLDITSRKATEARIRALAALDATLLTHDTPSDLAFAAAETLGQTLGVGRAGYGTVNLASETIAIERGWTAPGVPALEPALRFRDYGSYIEDLQRGETVVVTDARRDPRTAANADALGGIGVRSFINMPVTEQGGLVALLYITQHDARVWTPEELAFVREVAQRARMAVARRQAEQDLRTTASEFEALVENVSQLAWTAAPDGQIYWYNRRWYTYTGTTLADMQGEGWRTVHHPDHVARVQTEMRAHWAAGVPWEGVYLLRSASGEFRSFLTRAEPIRDDSGAILRWFGTNTDITAQLAAEQLLRELNDTLERRVADAVSERVKTEEQLRQSQKMEAVGQLTGGLAHDFNNLLTGITGSLELLQTRISQGRLAEVDRYLAAANGAARRAAALTHRLLAFSRRQTLSPKSTDINTLVSGMEELVRRTVGPAVKVEVSGSVGLWNTLVDPSQLENALLNLCINARDAMPAGGRLTIETANKWIDPHEARLRSLEPGQYVVLAVSDTGTGMAPDIVQKAFDPFFTTKPLGQGTGLGLSMIYGFTQQSGGQARIYSEVGKGTTVRLYLPRHTGAGAESDATPPSSGAPRARMGATVLVVDDEPTVRMLVADVLGELGYETLEAEDGATGLKILESKVSIDLLITDVGLPGGLNGRQVADAAQALRPALKVLFITGYAENAVIDHGHLDPGMHVLTKPFAMEALGNRVKELVG